MKQEQKTQPTCLGVSWHAELSLTSCEQGGLPSHVLQKAEVAGIAKKANYSIRERKYLSTRRVQVYNHHTEGESAVIVNGNTLRYLHQMFHTLKMETRKLSRSRSEVLHLLLKFSV